MREEVILRTATFNPKVKSYWLYSPLIILVICVVTIPLIPVWLIVGNYFTERYMRSLSCVLTERDLIIKRGILFKVEKTIPLEKITDLAQLEGPVMRYLDLKALQVETAGQSGPGALVQMIGIVDTNGFRDAVLAQRDKVGSRQPVAAAGLSASAGSATMTDIRDSLQRIESLLEKRWS